MGLSRLSPLDLNGLEQVPQKLVIHFVVMLQFGRLHIRAESTRTAISRSAFQVDVAAFHVRPEELGGPLGFFKIFYGHVDVVREVPLGRAQILDFRGFAFEPRFENGVDDEVRIGVWRHRTRSEEHTSELQSHLNLVSRLLLETKKTYP